MGYYTYFTINKIKGSDKDFDNLLKDIDDETGLGFSEDTTQEAKWGDYEEDCLKLSKKYPDLIFQIDGDGENSDDLWAERFHNGDCESTHIEYPGDFTAIATYDERKAILDKILPETRKKYVEFISSLLKEKENQSETVDIFGGQERLSISLVNPEGTDPGILQLTATVTTYDENARPSAPARINPEHTSIERLDAITSALLETTKHTENE